MLSEAAKKAEFGHPDNGAVAGKADPGHEKMKNLWGLERAKEENAKMRWRRGTGRCWMATLFLRRR